MLDCVFCEIARGGVNAVTLYEDDALMAFLDCCPIRSGHSQIITKKHHCCPVVFEVVGCNLSFANVL